MSKALDEFVTTGKLNFGDFAKSIIKDMLAIQLRASANNLFAMIGKSLFSSPVSLAEPLSGARANGGPVESGGAYMVGERGPELFVPRSAGAIVPNHSMAMGGSTNITNYNIQAIDTKSFEDRILGSSKAVWAANAYGAKNLSLGRGRT
jgi:phage-related minor tail protein